MPADPPLPNTPPDSPTFEAALEQLEALIARIESGDIGLEASLAQHEEGTRLIKHCRSILDTAEARIMELEVREVPGGAASSNDEMHAPFADDEAEGDSDMFAARDDDDPG